MVVMLMVVVPVIVKWVAWLCSARKDLIVLFPSLV
jgi:hypothetical protein